MEWKRRERGGRGAREEGMEEVKWILEEGAVVVVMVCVGGGRKGKEGEGRENKMKGKGDGGVIGMGKDEDGNWCREDRYINRWKNRWRK